MKIRYYPYCTYDSMLYRGIAYYFTSMIMHYILGACHISSVSTAC